MRKPISISELLARGNKKMSALQAGANAAQKALAAVQHSLGPDLAPHIFGASLSGDPLDTLTLLVESGAYATRVRYALPDALADIASTLELATIKKTQIKVRPRPSNRPA